MEDLIQRLTDKSVEAFIMGLEIYNKPTIKYRIEGFSFFICNSWELMLKAKVLKDTQDESAIYYKDNPDRTITLEKTISLIFTNSKDPLRQNLERIIHLRNTSTHFITEDYETIYAPLFQACVQNYVEKLNEFHSVDIREKIAQNFLVLGVNMSNLSDSDLKAKYSKAMAEKIIQERQTIGDTNQMSNPAYAIPIVTQFFITKNKNKADLVVAVNKNSEMEIQIVKEMQNPNLYYPYTTNKAVTLINKRLVKKSIPLKKMVNGSMQLDRFTTNDFQLFNQFYNIKSKEVFSFYYEVGNRYSYSSKLIDFIVEEIEKDPENIIQNLKLNIKK